MNKSLIVSFLLGLTNLSLVNAQQRFSATAVPREVTVFSVGAEITNTVEINLPKGSSLLYIQNVARDIDVNSVQISGPEGITVLSVSQGRGQDIIINNPKHRKLKDSLDRVSLRKETLVNKQKAAQGALKILNNEQLIAGSGKVNVADISQLVDYYQLKSVDLNTSIEALTKSINEEDKVIQRLNEQIKEFTGGGGVLIVQMANSKAFQGRLSVSYITRAANWQAYYDLRVKTITSPLEIYYKAKVMQSTGVDWKNVKLMLSTGNPSQNGDAPLLNPTYAQFNALPLELGKSLSGQVAGFRMQNRIQSIPMLEKTSLEVADEVLVQSPRTAMNENQLSATFDIEVPYDILSNGQPHAVTLREYVHPAVFKYYSVPKLDKDAFLIAEVNDFEKLNLVSGEANIIFENMFVGSSFINTNITADTLNLSMGRDKSISIKRERVMDGKSNLISGGSRRQTYTYELRVRNNKSTPILMLMKDQYPISTDKAIEIELTDSGGAAVNKETGILTWTIDVKPGETKVYRFSYLVKYPKNRTISVY